jgi:Protein of unknown function (DUF1631)
MQATPSHKTRTVNLLDDCHSLVLKRLKPKIGKLFENSDSAFLEFAEKAQTGSSQIRFIEAMALVQKDRTRIEEIFYREIGKSFSSFGAVSHSAASRNRDNNSPLTLLSKEDADIEVAIQNMVSSASLGATMTLVAMLQRLAVLNHGRKIEEKDIPGGPSCLAHGFHSAIREIPLDHETRLIVYLLFDKIVLANTRLLYEDYNKLLFKAGILPHLKFEVYRNPSPAPASTTRKAGTDSSAPGEKPATQGQSLGDELFESVLQLLSRKNRYASAEPANPLPQQEVVSAIQQLQSQRQVDPFSQARPDPSLPVREQQEQLVNTMLQRINTEREQLFQGIDRRRLPSADTQVIDLVGMMFEYLLRDENLPSIAKAELCRLHTPYLKIAIIDKSLFTSTEHPGHKLLNALARAGTRWVFDNDPERGIFPCIRKIVQRIIEDFQTNFKIFTEQLQFLETNLQTLENKAAAIEERARQAASGKEKLEQARYCATATIESLVSANQVPPELRKVLGDVWLDKLMFIYLREPGQNESPSWKLATRAIKTILWSIKPRRTDDARNELIERLPEVRRQTKQALEMLGAYGTSDYRSQLELIHRLQDAAVSTHPSHNGDHIQDPAAAADQSDTGTASGNDTGGTGVEPEKVLTPEEEAALEKLGRVSFGTWFNIQEDPALQPLQVKLSWYSGISGNYMFVNSLGIKSLMIRSHELASLLVSGRASIIEQEQQPFIQRTLTMIRRMLAGNHQAVAN